MEHQASAVKWQAARTHSWIFRHRSVRSNRMVSHRKKRGKSMDEKILNCVNQWCGAKACDLRRAGDVLALKCEESTVNVCFHVWEGDVGRTRIDSQKKTLMSCLERCWTPRGTCTESCTVEYICRKRSCCTREPAEVCPYLMVMTACSRRSQWARERRRAKGVVRPFFYQFLMCSSV